MFITTLNANTAKPAPKSINHMNLDLAPSGRISCVWPGALDVPANIKRFCRACEIITDLDPCMRLRFKGRRSDVLALITKIAPDNPDLAARIAGTITEA
ncbi:hypothetical protein pEaSNUABM34_00292 [Erwinia phage pEa_SNUABM_34]|nr:hypothetical protein pEaSNUABM34_00292 [Erwinia phage pEa_SNUABM_34]QYW05307.1 hypothetical protein pEaSNUABM21_00293 [Erwinia phage pEa_SNUABM_21]